MLDLRRLDVFRVVAEEGSFTSAATRLNMTQSAVSQQIGGLERDVGSQLLERLARGVRLTSEGLFLLARARQLLRDARALERDMAERLEAPKSVNLGVFTTAGANLIPTVVRAFKDKYPTSQLILHAFQHEDLAQALLAGQIDVGLTWDYDFLRRPIDGIEYHHLLTDPLHVLFPLNHTLAEGHEPVRLASLAEEPWVVRVHRIPAYERAFETMCQIAGFQPRIAFRAEDYQSVQGLVAADVGLGLVPRLSLIAQRPDIVARPIMEPSFARLIGAATLSTHRERPLVQRLLDLLLSLWKADAA
jgi:DNA-binding transcriptional LysR family regulator